jgi:hypothetical protein
MDWLTKTDWPSDLQQFIEEFACSPLATNSPNVDMQRLSRLAKSHARQSSQPALAAALYLIANDLDASHELSQEIHTHTGSYLHGIMHRRERDFSNAKYWFHRAGDMDCFANLFSNLAPKTVTWLTNNGCDSSWRFDPVQLTDWHRLAVNQSNLSAVDNDFHLAIDDIAWQEWRSVVNTLIGSGNSNS